MDNYITRIRIRCISSTRKRTCGPWLTFSIEHWCSLRSWSWRRYSSSLFYRIQRHIDLTVHWWWQNNELQNMFPTKGLQMTAQPQKSSSWKNSPKTQTAGFTFQSFRKLNLTWHMTTSFTSSESPTFTVRFSPCSTFTLQPRLVRPTLSLNSSLFML